MVAGGFRRRSRHPLGALGHERQRLLGWGDVERVGVGVHPFREEHPVAADPFLSELLSEILRRRVAGGVAVVGEEQAFWFRRENRLAQVLGEAVDA